MRSWWKAERPILALLIVFFVLGVYYSMAVPLWEGPDETAHFAYVRHLIENRSLPIQQLGNTAHTPPLYYIVAALVTSVVDLDDAPQAFHFNRAFIWAELGGTEHNAAIHHTVETFPYQGIALAAHLARLVSVIAGVATVALTYAIARHIFPEPRGMALLAAALTAFNPQFLFITSLVNSDGMAAAMSTLTLWQITRAIDMPSRWQRWAWAGAFCSLALLAKPNAVVIGAVAGIMLFVVALRQRSWATLWRGALAFGLAFLALSGWWFVRNWTLYGDPLGWGVFVTNIVDENHAAHTNWSTIRTFFTTQLESYWARFGWMTIWPPRWVYPVLKTSVALSLAGLGIWLWKRPWRTLDRSRALSLVALVAFILGQELFLLRGILTMGGSWHQGRYLFPAIAAFSTLLAVGLWNLAPRKAAPFVAGALGAALLLFAVLVPAAVIRPHYETPTLAKWQLWAVPHRMDVVFGEQIRLLGYDVESTGSTAHDVQLTLYWEAVLHPDVDYSVFVHLVDPAGAMAAQSDMGLGSDVHYASSAWWEGDIVPSHHTLTMPNAALEDYEVRVGVYYWADGSRLLAAQDGAVIGDWFTLDPSTWVLR